MESNKTFSLEELLAGEITMVIPDMQRDYCWGDPMGSDLPSVCKVTTFVKGVLYLYSKQRSSVLGLIYGYEQPIGSNRINIIDGQQRLTTLYLLVGMLYRRTSSPKLRQMLISDYQLIDECSPRILYQTRREAFYFMSDLVINFFLNRDGRLSMLEKSNWYFDNYDADPSVKSFISALRLIDQALEEADAKHDFDFEKFSDFVRHEIKFLYCDFPDRATAEHTFITINTTGEPLTISQKMRSLSLAHHSATPDAAETWNEIEDWFWVNRHNNDIDRVAQMYLTSLSEAETFEISHLFDFFHAYQRMAQCCDYSNPTPIGADYNDVGEFAILPTIAYIRRFGDKASDHDVRQLCHMLCNIARYQRPASSGLDTQTATEMVQGMKNPDLVEILKWHQAPRRIINDEERAKLDFISQHIDERRQAEELIAIAECHPAINGRGSRILPWCEGKLDKLRHYICRLYHIFGLEMPVPTSPAPNTQEIDKQPALDLLRRALLTIKHQEYPIVRRGDSVLSLCWNDYDWQRLIISAPGLIRQLIDRCDSSPDKRHPHEVFQEMINRFSNASYPYYFILKNEDTIAWARKRQLLRPCSAFLSIYDIQRVHPRWWVEQHELQADAAHWHPIRMNGSKCLYTDHLRYNIAIELYYTPEEKHKYRIEVFARQMPGSGLSKQAKSPAAAYKADDTSASDRPKSMRSKDAAGSTKPFNIKTLINPYDRYFIYDQRRSRFLAPFRTAPEALSIFHSLLKCKI